MAKIHATLAHKYAWDSFRAQKSRCEHPSNAKYKWYGAKGIKVEYSYKEFEEWYVREYNSTFSPLRVTVSRIYHDENYCFTNIKLETRSENSKERNRRCPQTGKPNGHSLKKILVYSLKTGEEIAVFRSQTDCAKTLAVSASHISQSCMGKYTSERRKAGYNMFGFRFLEANG
jgi:hypothetical protein